MGAEMISSIVQTSGQIGGQMGQLNQVFEDLWGYDWRPSKWGVKFKNPQTSLYGSTYGAGNIIEQPLIEQGHRERKKTGWFKKGGGGDIFEVVASTISGLTGNSGITDQINRSGTDKVKESSVKNTQIPLITTDSMFGKEIKLQPNKNLASYQWNNNPDYPLFSKDWIDTGAFKQTGELNIEIPELYKVNTQTTPLSTIYQPLDMSSYLKDMSPNLDWNYFDANILNNYYKNLAPQTPSETEFPEAKRGLKSDNNIDVEAEGGEYLVSYDNNKNPISVRRIKGKKHEQGGEDIVLKENEAVLPADKFAMLQQGIPLKDILDTLPNAEEAPLAVEGTDNPEENVEWYDMLYPNSLNNYWGFKSGYDVTKRSLNPRNYISTNNNYPTKYILTDADKKRIRDKVISESQPYVKPVSPEELEQERSMEERVMEKMIPVTFGQQNPDLKITRSPSLAAGLVTIPPSKEITSKEMMASKYNYNIPKILKGKQGEWDYLNMMAMNNALSNTMSLLYNTLVKPDKMDIARVDLGQPIAASVKYESIQPYINSLNSMAVRQIKQANETGQGYLKPTIINNYMNQISELSSKLATLNLQKEVEANKMNVQSGNQFSLAQASLDQDQIKTQAQYDAMLEQINQKRLEEATKSLYNLGMTYPDLLRAKEEKKYEDQMKKAQLAYMYKLSV